MRWHCGSLTPNRYEDPRFLNVFRKFVAIRLGRGEAEELAVFLATPGFLPGHFCTLFHWTREYQVEQVRIVRDYFNQHHKDEIERLAQVNAASITLDDGLEWLRAVFSHTPDYAGTVPWWTSLALAELREDLGNFEKVGEVIHLPRRALVSATARLRAWARLDRGIFEPVTGQRMVGGEDHDTMQGRWLLKPSGGSGWGY